MSIIRRLEQRHYKSTRDADARLKRLSHLTGWPDHVITRLALTRSLRDPSIPPGPGTDRAGKELRGGTFFGSSHHPAFLPWSAAMLAEHAGRSYEDDDDAHELVAAHWHRGIAMLEADVNEAGGDFQKFLVTLARQAAELGNTSALGEGAKGAAWVGRIKPITLPVGRVRPDTTPLTITVNDTRKHSNSHTAISGMSGSGKTQLAMQMLATFAKAVTSATGIIFVDFAKGDVAANQKFANSINARVYRLPGDVLPVGPFHLPDYSDDSVRLAAEEKREVYSSLFSNIGPKQQGRLVQALRSSYASLRSDREPAPDLAYVQSMLEQIYQNDGIQSDSLTELFRRLNAYRLFWSRDGGIQTVSPLHMQRWIVDIHELSGLKEVTAFTLIEQLYREMRGLSDSEIDEQSGLRHVRCVLVIDEAQYYLKAKNRFLQGIIREGRSKGFMVMLMCQSPDDFDQADFDYTEQLQFTYMLQCKTEPKSVSRLLSTSREEAKRLAMELGRMEPLHGVGRIGAAGVTKFRIEPFFELSR